MNTKMMRFLVISILVLIISCQGKNKLADTGQEQTQETFDPRRLVVHKEDLGVKIALKNDSLYSKVENSLIEEDGMTQEEAMEEVQFMINNKLLVEPALSYYDEEGRQSKTFKYSEFKKYIQIVKDSVARQ